MDITSLSLTYFRNFIRVDHLVVPPASFLVAAAPNASGKTNFLESLMVLLRGRSWRSGLEGCVQWGQEGFLLQAEVKHREATTLLLARYELENRGLRLEENESPISVVTYYARYPLVLFLAEDTFLFTRGPEQRRNFMNSVLVSIPAYVAALVQYSRALRQRNAALKRASQMADVEAWTKALVEQAGVVWKHRESFIVFVNTQLHDMYEALAGERLPWQVRLATGLEINQLMDRLSRPQVFNEEKRYGYTLFGPHRDDIVITIHDRPVQVALSQGQMRSLVLALKLVAHRYLGKVTNEEPLLLLDEALSELDEARQDRLLRGLPHAQIVLTCTAVPASLKQRTDVHLLDLRQMVRVEGKNQGSESGSERGLIKNTATASAHVAVQAG